VLTAAIREAINQELTERGYQGVTFEGVARRAQTSKSVLYRRYRTRTEMVIDALTPADLPGGLLQSSGSLREDLLAIAALALGRFRAIGFDTYRSLIAEADEEQLAAITAVTSAVAVETIERVLQEARARGELGSSEIPQRVAMTLLALLRHELFFNRDAVNETTLIELVDAVYLPLLQSVSHGQGLVPPDAAS
jgi:AcrR family transcriptional regulator